MFSSMNKWKHSFTDISFRFRYYVLFINADACNPLRNESCLCSFKIRNQIETSLKHCLRQHWFFFECLLSEPIPRENFIVDTEVGKSGVFLLSFLNKIKPNGGTDGNN